MSASIDHADHIGRAATRIVALARDGDLSTPAPGLGRWKVEDVVAHLGGVHEWANRILRESSMDGPGARKSKLAGSDLIDWFEAGARSLVETIRSTDPTAPCPNFNPGSPSLSQWWFRRQLHETMVHRWDIERAFDDTTAIVGSIAVDGVDEFLDTFVRTRGKQSLTAPLTITSRKPERSWTLRPAAKPGRLEVAPGGAEDAVAQLSAEAEALLLTLWGRLDPDQLAVDGDATVAASYFGP